MVEAAIITNVVEAVIPEIGDEPYDSKKYNDLKLVPFNRLEGPVPEWGLMPECFTTSLQKRAPLSCLRKALADRLCVEETHVTLVCQATAGVTELVEFDLSLSQNGVPDQGPLAKKRHQRKEIQFQLQQGTLPGSLAREEKSRAEERERLARLKERERIEAEERALQDSLSRWQNWRSRILNGALVGKTQMPPLSFGRLMAEFRSVQKSMDEDAAFVERCEPAGENLLIWHVDMSFPEDSAMQQSLEELVQQTADENFNVLTVQVCFPPDYPHSPPHIYAEKPRLKEAAKHGKNPVSFGGRICSPLLTSMEWNSKVTMPAVLEQVQQELVSVGAEVDVGVAVRTPLYLAPPVQLDRTATDRFPTMYDFCKPDMKLGSPDFLGPLLGADWWKKKTGDSIGLPGQFQAEIYGNLGEVKQSCPILFEVTSRGGRKVHCGKPDFFEGLSPGYAVLPQWLIQELLVGYDEKVRIRCVALDLVESVTIQPHYKDFYDAVQEAGGDAGQILTSAFQDPNSGYCALTEDTAVQIQIGGRAHMVQILSLQPTGAVRIIDQDVRHFFEVKVDFEKAPDLEYEEDAKKRIENLIANHKKKQAKENEEPLETGEESQEARINRIKKEHFEWLKQTKKALVDSGGDDGKEGEVQIKLRLPGNGQIIGKFRKGAPVVALVALALDSDWAKSCHPWGIKCIQPYPRKELSETDTISVNDAITVAEVKPNSSDEILAWINPNPSVDVPVTPVVANEIPHSTESITSIVNDDIPQYDEDALMRATEREFCLQCEAISKQAQTELKCMVRTCSRPPYQGKRGQACCIPCAETMGEKHDEACNEYWIRWKREHPAAAQSSSSSKTPGYLPSDAPPIANEDLVKHFCTMMNVDAEIARQYLEAAKWNQEQAIALYLG